MKHYLTLISGLLILLFASCSTPKNIIKLSPDSKKTSWFYGQEFASDSVFGILAKAGFDEVTRPWYAFDLDIVNRSNMPYLVDPAKIFIVPLNGKNEPMGDTIYAQDPESKILELDKKLAINESRQKNQLGTTLLAAGIDIATGVAVTTDHNPRNDNFRTDMLGAAMISNEINNFQSINLNELRDSWKASTLRKTTLEKGYAIHGKIFIPIYPNASYIQLNIPVDNELIKINFMQVQYIP